MGRPSLIKDAESNKLDLVLHIGDFAYDFISDNGKNGDQFLRDMEPLISKVPYMVAIGNHENSCDFNQYVNRFQNAPANDKETPYINFRNEPINGKETPNHLYGRRKNNLWYSFKSGLAYFIFLNTEIYVYDNTCISVGSKIAKELRIKQ